MVLIVEDSEACQAALEVALSRLRLVVKVVSTAEQGLETLRGEEGAGVQALVTDLDLAGMDGFELIQSVRADTNFASLPIVVISGDTDASTPQRVLALGANAYFEKPYSPSRVRQTLEKLIYGTSGNT